MAIRFFKNLLFISYSHLFFVPLQCRRTIIIYVSKHKIFRSHGARDTLLSQHQADVSLAEIEGSFAGKSRLSAPFAIETPHIPSIRSQ